MVKSAEYWRQFTTILHSTLSWQPLSRCLQGKHLMESHSTCKMTGKLASLSVSGIMDGFWRISGDRVKFYGAIKQIIICLRLFLVERFLKTRDDIGLVYDGSAYGRRHYSPETRDSLAFPLLDVAADKTAVRKRPASGFFGELTRLSEKDHQRFLCIYCAKYTHICDPFQFCYL